MLNEKMIKLEQSIRDARRGCGCTEDQVLEELEGIMKNLVERDDPMTEEELHNFKHLWVVLPRVKRMWAISRLEHFAGLRS
jgi:hypothetical protein